MTMKIKIKYGVKVITQANVNMKAVETDRTK